MKVVDEQCVQTTKPLTWQRMSRRSCATSSLVTMCYILLLGTDYIL